VVSSGEKVVQETRRWDEASGKTYSMRSKEEAHDYRYFPEPDLPPLVVDPAFVADQRTTLEELPVARRARLEREGLSPSSAAVLTSHPGIAVLYDEAFALSGSAGATASFIQNEVLRDTTTHGLDAHFPVSAKQVAEILVLVKSGKISGKQGKEVYAAIKGTDKSPDEWVRESGLAQMSDESEIEAVCRGVIEQNASAAASYRAGKTALLGFFVGQVMKQTRGRANPAAVNTILARLLAGP
jgi:aspartyl-tRNA(Asn)/glutamyl-tRNA(Gln) amidotransferase subunit B